MAIEIRLFGFGEDRPAAFAGRDRLDLDIATPATPRAALAAAGIDDTEGLVLMFDDRVVPPARWDDRILGDETRLTLLSAFEGG